MDVLNSYYIVSL